MGAVPVAIHNVHFSITVEVGQGDTSPMLVGIIYTWGERQAPQGGVCAYSMNTHPEQQGRVALALFLPSWEMGRHSCVLQALHKGRRWHSHLWAKGTRDLYAQQVHCTQFGAEWVEEKKWKFSVN